jgi:hypothetical protein
MAHAGRRRGSRYIFGGPHWIQLRVFGPLEYCIWRQDIGSGALETRAISPDQWPPDSDPEDVFEETD